MIVLRNNLTVTNLRKYLSNFFINTNFNSRYVYVLIKVFYHDTGGVKTLGNKTIIDTKNKNDIKNYSNSICRYYIEHYEEMYDPEKNDMIVFNWLDTNKTIYNRIIRNKNINKYNINTIPKYHDIPYNVSYNSWGSFENLSVNKSIIKNITFNSNINLIEVDQVDPLTNLITVHFNDGEIFKFNDIDLREFGNNYKRVFLFNNIEVYFKDNVTFFYFDPNVSPPKYKKDKNGNLTNERIDIIKPLAKESKITEKFMTFDLETYFTKDKNIKLLSASLFDGKETYSVYKGNFKNDNDMLDNIFDVLLSDKYNGRFVYIHNGAKFDLNYLVSYLLDRKGIKLDPLYKDGLFLNLTVNYGKKHSQSITIRDSYLLLPSSLSKLGKSLNVECQKDIFPYDFPNASRFSYVGDVPTYEFFDPKKVSLNDYNNYVERFKNSKWNLKKVTINYCEKDCISLYQVINKFSNLIFDKFKVSIFKAPTLASLTFMIYRTKYIKNKNIPILDRYLYDILVKSYFGGHVDCYIPENNSNYSVKQITEFIKNNNTENLETIKHYDINSLYPSVMKNYLYPTDILGYFIGDISLINNFDHFKFGIYKVLVNCPENLQHPILPIKQKGRTIYPVGTWEGWYNSLELSNAQKYGYTIKILEGYLFDTDDLFSNFVNDLYSIKQNTNKSDPMYLISKLLLNSLYGKFGINPHLFSYKFIPKFIFEDKELSKTNFIYKDWKKIGNYYLVGTEDLTNNIISNVAIAQAVTSFSRIVMSVFKNNPDYILYYSDTDSIFVDKYLPEEFVSETILGKFKLEAEYLKFIALGPKVYGALETSGVSYTKVKGFKDKISLEKLELLLNKDYQKLDLKHEKWFKNMNNSLITVKMSPYDLKISDSKRIPIFTNNKFSNTNSKTI